jgi:hypothetical protein
MADGDITLTIDAELAERLKAVSADLGKTMDEYARQLLDAYTGLDPRKEDEAYWAEMGRICDETERDGGVPWEQVQARLLNFGQKR